MKNLLKVSQITSLRILSFNDNLLQFKDFKLKDQNLIICISSLFYPKFIYALLSVTFDLLHPGPRNTAIEHDHVTSKSKIRIYGTKYYKCTETSCHGYNIL